MCIDNSSLLTWRYIYIYLCDFYISTAETSGKWQKRHTSWWTSVDRRTHSRVFELDENPLNMTTFFPSSAVERVGRLDYSVFFLLQRCTTQTDATCLIITNNKVGFSLSLSVLFFCFAAAGGIGSRSFLLSDLFFFCYPPKRRKEPQEKKKGICYLERLLLLSI